jgi:hypothetical protein
MSINFGRKYSYSEDSVTPWYTRVKRIDMAILSTTTLDKRINKQRNWSTFFPANILPSSLITLCPGDRSALQSSDACKPTYEKWLMISTQSEKKNTHVKENGNFKCKEIRAGNFVVNFLQWTLPFRVPTAEYYTSALSTAVTFCFWIVIRFLEILMSTICMWASSS